MAIIGNQAFSMTNFRGPLIRRLAATCEVLALAPDYSPELRAKVRGFGATPIDTPLARTGINPIADLRSLLVMTRQLRQLRIDVSLAFAVKPVIYGTIAAWLAGVPRRHAVIEGVGYAFITDGRVSIKRRTVRVLLSALYKGALSLTNSAFFLNDDDCNDFKRWGLVSPAKASVVGPIGLALEDWPMLPPSSSPVTFLLVARLLKDKGVVEFAEAARRIVRQHPEVRFVLLGDVDSNPQSISQADIRQWVDEGIVTWPGHVTVPEWMPQASVFVLPSYREGMPRSTQEAMASGRPVITTDVPGCRDTVIEGVNGFLVPPRDVDALVSAMEGFISDPSLIAKMGIESRTIAELRFDADLAAARLLALIGL